MRYTIVMLFCFAQSLCLAQVVNDRCDTALDLGAVSNFCSAPAVYSNEEASVTPDVPCFNANLRDVWFRFEASSFNASITVIGDKEENGGGTLKRPDIGIFSGECGSLISINCSFTTDNFGLVRLTGLDVGGIYYIRISSLPENTGTFQLCINDFLIEVDRSSDCYPATRLCKNDPVSLDSLPISVDVGSRALSNCLGDFAEGKRAQWFVFTAKNAGDLTFTITPKNDQDNIDFAIFELLTDTTNCIDDSVMARCMGSGPTSLAPGGCLGPIGLRSSASDINETAGCSAGYDNYLAPLSVMAGDRYSMVVVNQTSRSGFDLVFGSNIEFVSPSFELQSDVNNFCNGNNAIISLADESFLENNIVMDWSWDFGEAANPATAATQGPHSVNWSVPGEKLINAQFITTDGCEVDTFFNLTVIPCCDPANPLNINTTIVDASCHGLADGVSSFEVSGGFAPYFYNWESGSNAVMRNDLEPGTYTLTITDDALCDSILTFDIGSPEEILVNADVITPECGEPTGSIALNVIGGLPDYGVRWTAMESFTTDFARTDLLPDIYNIEIRDANNCIVPSVIDLTTDDILSVDSARSTLQGPLCFGDENGIFDLQMKGGAEPYQYDYNDGQGFGPAQRIEQFGDSIFSVVVRDAEGCLERLEIDLSEPTPLLLDSIRVDGFICHDDIQGDVGIYTSGGTPSYRYFFNDRAVQVGTDAIARNVQPNLYQVRIQDENACEIETPLDLRTPTKVEPLSNNRFEMSRGDLIPLNLSLEQGTFIRWMSDNLISCTDCHDPELTPKETMVYTYELTNELGCSSIHTVNVIVDSRIPVFVPNAISPNQDGHNDELRIYAGEAVAEIRKMLIFDRWGNILYQNDAPVSGGEGWNGQYKGRDLGAGTYLYSLAVLMRNGQEEMLSGEFYILR